jgi:hypothetical protein
MHIQTPLQDCSAGRGIGQCSSFIDVGLTSLQQLEAASCTLWTVPCARY